MTVSEHRRSGYARLLERGHSLTNYWDEQKQMNGGKFEEALRAAGMTEGVNTATSGDLPVTCNVGTPVSLKSSSGY